ncbi:MAG: GLUG motif-containing protein, partial [Thermoplasmata archaeon]|nr:GLUG motif-containing protein [Thermoplasmata archaeon]
MKQLTAFLLAMIMIATPLSVLSVVSSAEVTPVSPLGGGTFGGGDGSIGNPYIITDVLDLQAMSGNLNAHYMLGNDIDASATAGWNGGQGFNPIGVTMARFNGTFDGQGHRITGLYINRPFTTSVGLFGNIGLGAMISNVTVDNAAVTGYDSTGILVGTVYAPTGQVFNAAVSGIVAGRNGTGGLVGFLGSAVGLHNCSSSASVSGNGYVGGLVGESWKPITDCAASGSVIGKLHGIGGLVGRMWYENITRCHATGAVSTNTSAGMNIGGLVGEQSFVSSTFDSYATGYVTGWGYLGGLVGYFRGDIIRDSHATGDVSSPQNVYRVGGLVGTVGDGSYQNCVIYRCYATGNVDGGTRCGGLLGSTNYEVSECYAIGDVDSTGLSGGLVGVLEDTTSNITDCYATGEVSSSVSDRVGGLVGVSMATISNCYASGPVSGPAPIGGLISSDGGGLGVEVNCFWDTTTSGIATSVGSETGFATAQMITEATFAGAGWDFAAVWWMADGFTRPFLRMEWDNEITNSHQLQLMAMNLSADYTIENYIDMSDTKVSKEMWGTNATSGKGFSPVGSSASKFVGSLDGQGNIIGYLYIKSTANYVGLFGATNGEISNLEMGTADITGYDYVGALVGRMEGSVINCGSQGTIQGHDNVGGLVGEVYFNANLINASTNIVVNGNAFVGGLAGTHMGTLASEGAAWGQVTGYQYVGGLFGSSQSSVMLSISHTTVQGAIMVGGFIGDNSYDVEKCVAYGDVIGIGGIKQQIGGFVGSNYGNIRNSYSWGDVAGNYFVGGFIGQEAGTGQIVEDCYSVGQVTALGDVGGFLGEYFMPGTTTAYTDCFWDNQTSNQTASDRGTGKNTEDMMLKATFMNWNFTNTWGIYETNTYPFLQAIGPMSIPSADLTLTLSSSPSTYAQMGEPAYIYVNITNNGPDNAVNVNITLAVAGDDMAYIGNNRSSETALW